MNCGNNCPIRQVASKKSLDVYPDFLPCEDCKEWGRFHAELLLGKRLGKIERAIILRLAEVGKVCSNDLVQDDSRSNRVKVLRAINTLHQYGFVLIASETVEVSRKKEKYWYRSKVNKRVRTCELSRIGKAVMTLYGQAIANNKRIRWHPADIYTHATFMNDNELFSKYVDEVKAELGWWRFLAAGAAVFGKSPSTETRQKVEEYTMYLGKLEEDTKC